MKNIKYKTSYTTDNQPGATCAHVPELTRLKYFHGQLLSALDFQTEQNYFLEKLKLHNRCLHGYGTVCGLEVIPEPIDEDCLPQSAINRLKMKAELAGLKKQLEEAEKKNDQQAASELRAKIEALQRDYDELALSCDEDEMPAVRVRINCGLALDCEGNEIIVRQSLPIDLWQWLSWDDKKRVDPDGQDLYISICYCAMSIDPVRPVMPDSCGASSDCVYGKLRDAVRVKVTIDPPPEDTRCATCCEPCPEPCLSLAVIKGFKRGEPLEAEQIDNSVRRMIGTSVFTTITGISWTHGGEYTIDQATDVLGTYDESAGLKIQFSRPVLTETLVSGIVDLWEITGGSGEASSIKSVAGEIVNLPNNLTTDFLQYRQITGETLQNGDRLLITVRTNFILDTCCRPVDGTHVGGRVPILPGYEKGTDNRQISECVNPPLKFGPWTSGNGSPGGTFESWFYIKDDTAYSKNKRRK